MKANYRQMFGSMGAKSHSKNNQESEVLKYIGSVLSLHDEKSDLGRCVKVFNIIRQPKSGIIFYSRQTKRWYGSECESAQIQRLTKIVSDLSREVAQIKRKIG